MTAVTQQEYTIEIRTITNHSERSSIIAQYFGPYMVMAENCIYNTLEEMSEDYKGGMWAFHEITFGEEKAFYMAPDNSKTYGIECTGNYYSGTVSADAAGLIACLDTYCRYANGLYEKDEKYSERFTEMYHLLRCWAGEHQECDAIFSAID